MALNGPRTTQNRQLHTKQEVGQLYNNIIYFSRNRVDSHTKSYKSPDPGVPIQSLYTCINCMLGLPVLNQEFLRYAQRSQTQVFDECLHFCHDCYQWPLLHKQAVILIFPSSSALILTRGLFLCKICCLLQLAASLINLN